MLVAQNLEPEKSGFSCVERAGRSPSWSMSSLKSASKAEIQRASDHLRACYSLSSRHESGGYFELLLGAPSTRPYAEGPLGELTPR